MRAIWNGVVLAESDDTIVVEGNYYFPQESINWQYFKENNKHTTCPWKGIASYYDIEVDSNVNSASAWHYPEPKPAAQNIKGYIAFWKGVQVKS